MYGNLLIANSLAKDKKNVHLRNMLLGTQYPL